MVAGWEGAGARENESARPTVAEYRIRGVARLTGLSPDTIRKWESRYRAVTPRRDARGIRRYGDADVKRLSNLRAAIDLGYPIGEAVRLTPVALGAVLAQHASPVRQPESRTVTRPDAFVRAVFRGLEHYDAEQIDRLLTAAAQLLPPAEFVFDVMSPIFRRIGQAWRAGDLGIEQEHLFSAVARSVLGHVVRRYAVSSVAPIIVFATPRGEPHEFGIMLAAMLTASEGLRVHYLGPNMPEFGIARAAEQVRAVAIVIGIVRSRSKASLSRSINALADSLPRGVELIIGGKAATAHRGGHLVLSHLPSLQDFYDHIRAPEWRRRSTAR